MATEKISNKTDYTYSTGQQEFFDAAMSRKNIFLSGKAGTGKSYIVTEAINALREKNLNVAVVAPTGIAANNIGGQTLHSFFKFPIFGVLDKSRCPSSLQYMKKVYKSVDVLVVDEISMVRPDYVDGFNWVLEMNGVLGGLKAIQTIFVGDLEQLRSPINEVDKELLLKTYLGLEFLDAHIYPSLKVIPITLDTIHRQKDVDFIDALNCIRTGIHTKYFDKFKSPYNTNIGPEGIILAPHNTTVSEYNDLGLNALSEKKYVYNARIDGSATSKDFIFEETLELKEGCKIMHLINTVGLYNGALGTFKLVLGIPHINVKGTLHKLSYTRLEKIRYKYNSKSGKLENEVVGSIEQLPIKLAYALTIHKSQGLTFGEVLLDLTRDCFAPGQLYTALSRVKTPEGLKIKIKY